MGELRAELLHAGFSIQSLEDFAASSITFLCKPECLLKLSLIARRLTSDRRRVRVKSCRNPAHPCRLTPRMSGEQTAQLFASRVTAGSELDSLVRPHAHALHRLQRTRLRTASARGHSHGEGRTLRCR